VIEEAIMVWNMLFKGRWPLYDKWVEFVQQSNMKAVSRDTWQQLFEFALQNEKTVTNYDPDSAFSSVSLYVFVWLRSEQARGRWPLTNSSSG
jgi:hypothetical protein